jgi:hypothetical protein
MRNIGLVSAAVIAMAMAAMAGTVAASALPVIEPHRQNSDDERERLSVIEPDRREVAANLERMFRNQFEEEILYAVRAAEEAGLSGEAAQQRIRGDLQSFIRLGVGRTIVSVSGSESEKYIALGQAHRFLIDVGRPDFDGNPLRRGSDGDLAVSALLASWEAESRAERRPGINRGGSSGRRPPMLQSCYLRGLPDGCDAPRNGPGNATTGQPATDAATTEVQQSQTTDDSDLDDEAGEPD